MTKSDIINDVSSKTGLTKVETEAVLEGVLGTISSALKNGERVDIRGFGSFMVKERKARDSTKHGPISVRHTGQMLQRRMCPQ